MPSTSKCSRRSHAQWKALIARAEHSDLSVTEFCRRESVITASFYTWRNRLRAIGEPPSPPVRREALCVYLSEADVPIDTYHLERALRRIPLGRKNWMFCWSEVGAEAVATIQSLIVTCQLHDIDPYDYLVDVLQRIDRHPASEEIRLLPLRPKARTQASVESILGSSARTLDRQRFLAESRLICPETPEVASSDFLGRCQYFRLFDQSRFCLHCFGYSRTRHRKPTGLWCSLMR